MALTSLPAGSFQTTSPHKLCSSLGPKAHTHVQRGMCTLRQSRKKSLQSLPVRELGLGSPGPDPKGPQGMLPLRSCASCGIRAAASLSGADRPLSWNVENEVGFYVETVWGRVQVMLAGYVQRIRGRGQEVVLGSFAGLHTPSKGFTHTVSHVLLKTSASILALILVPSILGTLQPAWSGSTISERHLKDRRDSAH